MYLLSLDSVSFTYNGRILNILSFFAPLLTLMNAVYVYIRDVGLSEPDFYGDLVYKLKKIVGSNNFSAQLFKIISHKKDWL